jgi:hypothetical protein
LDASKNLLGRLIAYEDTSYLNNLSGTLALVNKDENIQINEGNIKLNITVAGDRAQLLWTYMENGVDYSPKSLNLVFQNRVLTELTDGWFLFTIGSNTVNISSDRAVEIARNAVKGFSWNTNGTTVSSFNVLSEPVSAVFHPNTKNSLALYPCWYVTLYLDKTYPGGVNSIAVALWADTGEIAQIKATSS